MGKKVTSFVVSCATCLIHMCDMTQIEGAVGKRLTTLAIASFWYALEALAVLVYDLELWVENLWFRIWDLGFIVSNLGIMAYGSRFQA